MNFINQGLRLDPKDDNYSLPDDHSVPGPGRGLCHDATGTPAICQVRCLINVVTRHFVFTDTKQIRIKMRE